MKKKLLIISALACFSGILCAKAQAVQDSVKVRLETSVGAEIGIDGDISSNNTISKKVAVGRHVVTVRYGKTYEKNYELDVTAGGEQYHTYMIDGKLNVEGVPAGADVYIDGLNKGKTPMTINVLGEHNVRIEKDPETYYDYSERIAVAPFGEANVSYALRKRPPKLYGMAMATWSPSGSVGGFVGICRRFGAYARFSGGMGHGVFMLDGNNGRAVYTPDYNTGVFGTGIYKKDGHAYGAFAAGFMARCHKFIYAYIGAGYASYAQRYVPDESGMAGFESNISYKDEVFPYGCQGVALDLGAIFKWKALLVSCGYTTMFGESYPDGAHHSEFYIGVGFSIHKNKDKR